MKKALSVFLCCILLAAFAPMVYAEDALIEKAFATYAFPAADEAINFSAITVPLGAHYTAQVKSVYYYHDGKYDYIADGDTVLAGVQYNVRIRFYAESGYRFDDSKTVYTINGEAERTLVDANMVQILFVAQKAADTSDDSASSKPTFRDRVATFFRDMRNRILYVIYVIRHLFGIKT